VGMVIGVIQYTLGGKHLGSAGELPEQHRDPAVRSVSMRRFVYAVVGMVALIGAILAARASGALNLSIEAAADATGVVIVSMAILYFAYMFFFGGLDSSERKRVSAVFVLFVFSALFWSGFEQAGSSLNLVAERLTNRVIGGWEMPASFLQSVNAGFIIILAPVFAWIWIALSRRSKEPSSPGKFTLGLLFLGLGFAVMIVAAQRSASGVLVSPMWLVLTYLLHTIGELCVSPVGLSTVTKLAPHRMVGQMMGVWFMSISLGNLIAGRVAGQFDKLPLPELFGRVTMFTLGGAVVLALLIIPIKRLMSGVK
jgi:proton-dependent oligopeptide transporter, POT family